MSQIRLGIRLTRCVVNLERYHKSFKTRKKYNWNLPRIMKMLNCIHTVYSRVSKCPQSSEVKNECLCARMLTSMGKNMTKFDKIEGENRRD